LHPTLASLIALQSLDTAADHARKRLAELPAVEQSLQAGVAAAEADVARLKDLVKQNHDARRALEKDVAGVDTRLARFEDHKAAVKTNHEYTALMHEIATAKAEKDGIEERILVLMEAADELGRALKGAEAARVQAERDAKTQHATLSAEAGTLTKELDRLAFERRRESGALQAAVMARYDQLIKGRRGLAVAALNGEICTACHVRLRPHVAQMVRRNEEIVQCESCQRILYFAGPPPP
jgi:predicted  nucleic acid-binding Zn-ribbon protein